MNRIEHFFPTNRAALCKMAAEPVCVCVCKVSRYRCYIYDIAGCV